ncbi:unnamed protein product [marine sediment metagenome]|uniref:Uncharacterized protein n=1 Tax=marine sediment metagenome TaxID=412755 RepID=X1MB95_9ZZZZ
MKQSRKKHFDVGDKTMMLADTNLQLGDRLVLAKMLDYFTFADLRQIAKVLRTIAKGK